MTYEEFFREKKEETQRLFDFYEDTKNSLKQEAEDIKQKLKNTIASLEEARKEEKPFDFVSSVAPIIAFGFMTEHPMVSLGFVPVFYAKEIKHFQEKSDKNVSRKERRRVARRIRFLEKKQERLEEQSSVTEERIEDLETITDRLSKEVSVWAVFEEKSQGRMESISESAIEIGNSLSASFRGDLMIELFGTIDAPVDVVALTKVVD